MESKTLNELADEYAQNAAVVEGEIEKCRKAIAKARLERRCMLVNRLERNLSILYSERSELLQTESHLRGYYEREERAAG